MHKSVVLASRNRGKLAEMQALLAPLGCTLRPISDFGDETVDEPAPTFVENALIKARHACRVSGLPAIADDSGIEVDALHGLPGVRSARYAGDDASDADNNRKLLAALDGVDEPQRGARYVCALVYLRHADDPTPLIALGDWRGTILREPRGTRGFGYDPLFLVPEQGCTAAELDPSQKNRLSHRARASERLSMLLHDAAAAR